MENLLFEDIYLKSLTFDEMVDFIIENGNQELSNRFLITFRRIIIRERIYSAIFLTDLETERQVVFIKKSNRIFRFNKDDLSMEYLCNKKSPFLNIIFKED